MNITDEIRKFLLDGEYRSWQEWMLDSDYTYALGRWRNSEDDIVDPQGCIEGAMEAAADDGGYDVDAFGYITNPGKFEGQRDYMPTAYQWYRNGFGDEAGDEDNTLFVTFDWNGKERTVRLRETDEGFIEEVTRFDEITLRRDIIGVWGEYGAHIDLYDWIVKLAKEKLAQ